MLSDKLFAKHFDPGRVRSFNGHPLVFPTRFGVTEDHFRVKRPGPFFQLVQKQFVVLHRPAILESDGRRCTLKDSGDRTFEGSARSLTRASVEDKKDICFSSSPIVF